MTVPEASVHKHDRAKSWKDEVGPAWQGGVKPVTQSASVQEPANGHFGLRILAADGRHHSAACSLVDNVDHLPP
jgi:hypothetical protein